MSTLQNYKGLQVLSPDPTGNGGLAINDDLKSLVDWSPRSNWSSTRDPNINDDSKTDSANNYQVGSHWLNTTTNALFMCVDAAVANAVWQPFAAGSPSSQQAFLGVYSDVAALATANPSPLVLDSAMVESFSVGVQSIRDVMVYFDGTSWKRRTKARFEDIDLADPYDNLKPELTAIPTADLSQGDVVCLTNLFNDRHLFEWDGTAWKQKTDWVIECVVLPDSSGNLIIADDADHIPRGIDPSNGISNASGTDFGFDLDHPHADSANTKLFSASATPNSEMLRYGLFLGGEYDKGGSQFEVRPQAGICGRVRYNGLTWEWHSTQSIIDDTDGITLVPDSSGSEFILTINHPKILGNSVPLFTPFRTGSSIPLLHSGSTVSSTVLKFRNPVSGVILDNAYTSIHFYLSYGTSYEYTNSMFTGNSSSPPTNAKWHYSMKVRVD